jgi:hypothetical protein
VKPAGSSFVRPKSLDEALACLDADGDAKILPQAPRPFRVPLYPVLPLIFCATSALLLLRERRAHGSRRRDRRRRARRGRGGAGAARRRTQSRHENVDFGRDFMMMTTGRLTLIGVAVPLVVASPSAQDRSPSPQKTPDVPYVPTNDLVLDQMLGVAKITKSDVVGGPSRTRTWDRLIKSRRLFQSSRGRRHRNGETLTAHLSLGCLTQGADETQCAIEIARRYSISEPRETSMKRRDRGTTVARRARGAFTRDFSS